MSDNNRDPFALARESEGDAELFALIAERRRREAYAEESVGDGAQPAVGLRYFLSLEALVQALLHCAIVAVGRAGECRVRCAKGGRGRAGRLEGAVLHRSRRPLVGGDARGAGGKKRHGRDARRGAQAFQSVVGHCDPRSYCGSVSLILNV